MKQVVKLMLKCTVSKTSEPISCVCYFLLGILKAIDARSLGICIDTVYLLSNNGVVFILFWFRTKLEEKLLSFYVF